MGDSPGPKVSSRSPSTAMTPARASTGCTDPGRIRSISLTPTGTTRPGAMGARTLRGASGERRAVTPCGSCRATGDSWPRMLDRPIASGSANAQKSWVSVAGSHTARLPTWRSVDTATSMSAVSARSPTRASSSLARAVTPSAGTVPVATKPAARPAIVASRTAGNVLLVPVDSASIGTSPAADAVTLAVPSPPRQTITCAPAVTIRRTASTVSCAVCRIGWPSRNSTSGHRPPAPRRRSIARNTAAEMPPRSVPSSTRCTPTAASAVSMRWIMLAFSAVGNTEACVTRRRMSRPDSGFATTPTIASPTAHLLAPTLLANPGNGNSRGGCWWAARRGAWRSRRVHFGGTRPALPFRAFWAIVLGACPTAPAGERPS